MFARRPDAPAGPPDPAGSDHPDRPDRPDPGRPGPGGVERHHDREAEIFFGPGALAASGVLDPGEPYALLSTPRARGQAPELAEGAAALIDVPPGTVDEIAAALVDTVGHARIVALGGGRVIDVAKAIAAARPPKTVTAVPTTLSGAEMTHFHRQARGVPPATRHARPTVVVNDPALSASAPTDRLAASSANALGHILVAIASTESSAIARAAARDAGRRIAAAWAGAPDRAELALGALMAGWAVDHSGLGLHHVMTQSAVRAVGVAHADANAALLPETVAAIATRVPEVGTLLPLARALRARSGAAIATLATDPVALERTIRLAVDRPELARIPPAPGPDELREIYLRAAGPPAT